MSKLKICIFSDIHYIDKNPEWKVKQKLVEYAEPLLDKMILKVNEEIKPDICIHLGDMIQASDDRKQNLKNISYIWNKCQSFKVPFVTLLGNHELKTEKDNKEVLRIIGYKDATFSIDINGYHLIFLGTDVNSEDEKFKTQYVSENDLNWLEEDLMEHKDKRIILFSHFGIADDIGIEENFWSRDNGESLMLRNRDKIKSLLKNKRIIAVFVGHQHWTKTITEDGIDYYMIGSIVENIKQNGVPDGVFFEIEINEDNIIAQEKHLENCRVTDTYFEEQER